MLHVALRAPRDAVINSDGKNVVPDVWEVLDKIRDFSEKVRTGSWVTAVVLYDRLVLMSIKGQYIDMRTLPGWSNRETTEGCYCNWYWRQLLRTPICAYCSPDRLDTVSYTHLTLPTKRIV